MPTVVNLYVTYQQLAVFDPSLPQPFNGWTDDHVAQGFSWRKGSVAFGTLEHDGDVEVEIGTSKAFPIVSPGITRSIVVPFHVPESNQVELATITESKILTVPNDVKGIFFEAGLNGDVTKYKITFVRGKFPNPAILVADSELTVPKTYLMDAEPG